jgi:hypothetical protein
MVLVPLTASLPIDMGDAELARKNRRYSLPSFEAHLKDQLS